MTNSDSTSLANIWPLSGDNPGANVSNFEALTTAEADAMPVELGVGTPRAAFALVFDSLNILSAFAWGKEARLARNKSAQLCELMNVG